MRTPKPVVDFLVLLNIEITRTCLRDSTYVNRLPEWIVHPKKRVYVYPTFNCTPPSYYSILLRPVSIFPRFASDVLHLTSRPCPLSSSFVSLPFTIVSPFPLTDCRSLYTLKQVLQDFWNTAPCLDSGPDISIFLCTKRDPLKSG